MKSPYLILIVFLLALFSSFKPEQACEYAGSNITYVRTETEKALAMKDLQLMRFHIYKALDAIAKSNSQLKECGCQEALERILDASESLKNATKAKSTAGTRILLNKALVDMGDGLEALNNHDEHGSPYGTDEVQFNSNEDEKSEKQAAPPDSEKVRRSIDSSLTKYSASLENVMRTVNCKEAYAFAMRIYEHCEQELLRSNLSEEKKYYNLKTKKITEEALQKLGDCLE